MSCCPDTIGEGVGVISMKSVEELDVYKLGMDIVVEIYKITRGFPKEELFGLSSQMRRAGVSITSNLAEGGSRNTTSEYKHFVGIAKGSAAELRSQVQISQKLGFISDEVFIGLTNKLNQIGRMLAGLIARLSITPTLAPTPNK